MNTMTKGDLKTTLAQAASALIDARRKAEGWEHYAKDLIDAEPGKVNRAFRSGVLWGAVFATLGSLGMQVLL